MKPSDNLLPLTTIHGQLGRWATIVTRCLRGGRGAKRLSDDEYARLHNELMKQCYLYLQSDDLAKRHLSQQLFTLLMREVAGGTVNGDTGKKAAPSLTVGQVVRALVFSLVASFGRVDLKGTVVSLRRTSGGAGMCPRFAATGTTAIKNF